MTSRSLALTISDMRLWYIGEGGGIFGDVCERIRYV